MAKKQFVIGAGVLAVVVGLVLGVASGFTLSKGEPATAQTQMDSAVPGPHTNAKIEQLKSELDSVAQYEMAYGCMTFGKLKQSEFCGASKERVDALEKQLNAEVHKLELADRTKEAIMAVQARVKELAGDPATEVSFVGTSANPYTNAVKRIEHWSDSKGFDYWVNPTNNSVVQFGPGPESKVQFAETGDLTTAQLRNKAEKFLSKNVADFVQVKSDYSFRQMSKPGNVSHAFRWEAKGKPTGEDVAPFVQVVMSPAGEVMSFDDVRSLYSN